MHTKYRFEFNLELICTSEFFKKLKLHELLQTRKNSRRKIAGGCFSKPFFSHSFPYKIFLTALHDIIGLQNFSLSFCQSLSRITMCNLHWCYSFCTGVTLELHCSQPIRSEYIFICIIMSITGLALLERR